jgi:translocation protein SEC72
MTPMWSRTARFANVYASAALDALSVFLWLTAWAAVASYVSAGRNKGTNTKASGCDNFGLGSAAKCKLSEATIVFGVMIMLLFGGTSYVSIGAVMHYRRTGQMPAPAKSANDFAAQTQDAFSSNLRTDDFDDEAGFDARQGGGSSGLGISRHDEDEYALLHAADNDDQYPTDRVATSHRTTTPATVVRTVDIVTRRSKIWITRIHHHHMVDDNLFFPQGLVYLLV